jgi:hypothetical protein
VHLFLNPILNPIPNLILNANPRIMAAETATSTPAAAPVPPAQATGPYDQFILFGDSLMEFSANQALGFGFMPALQHGNMLHPSLRFPGF